MDFLKSLCAFLQVISIFIFIVISIGTVCEYIESPHGFTIQMYDNNFIQIKILVSCIFVFFGSTLIKKSINEN